MSYDILSKLVTFTIDTWSIPGTKDKCTACVLEKFDMCNKVLSNATCFITCFYTLFKTLKHIPVTCFLHSVKTTLTLP